jgi:suppressor of fused-like protein
VSGTDAPGWTALDEALARLSPGTPHRFDVHETEGDPPLESIAALAREGHWLYVTYGLTELYAKSSEDLAHSGYGFELTFRLRRSDEPEPPAWPAALLRTVAQYVVFTGEALAPGHHVDAGGPLTTAVPTELTAALLVEDPELSPLSTAHGEVKFHALVGLHPAELDLLVDWQPGPLTELLGRGHPNLVTDPQRPSLLADPAMRAEIERRITAEGSALEGYATELRWDAAPGGASVEISLAATAMEALRRVLRGRLGHGRPVTLEGDGGTVELVPGDAPGWQIRDDVLVITLTKEIAATWREELAEQPGGAFRALLSDLWVRLVPIWS